MCMWRQIFLSEDRCRTLFDPFDVRPPKERQSHRATFALQTCSSQEAKLIHSAWKRRMDVKSLKNKKKRFTKHLFNCDVVGSEPSIIPLSMIIWDAARWINLCDSQKNDSNTSEVTMFVMFLYVLIKINHFPFASCSADRRSKTFCSRSISPSSIDLSSQQCWKLPMTLPTKSCQKLRKAAEKCWKLRSFSDGFFSEEN